MSWQPYRRANKPLLAIVSGDVPQAVGRIRQTVQKHSGSNGSAHWFEQVRAVPVLRETTRIDGTPIEITVKGSPILRIQLLSDFAPNAIENGIFSGQVFRPVGSIKLFRPQFLRQVSVPKFERRTTLTRPKPAPQAVSACKRRAISLRVSPT